MNRFLMEELKAWKSKKNRKPLIIEGARQVGKTWLITEFGKNEFDNYVYINFERQHELHDVLMRTTEPQKILEAISAISQNRIYPEKSLLIFDEIQEEPRALTALKYFCEDAPEYAVAATGSFMGIALHEGTSFPVGKVDMMRLYPMNYREFICAMGYDRLNELIENKQILEIQRLKSSYIELLRLYYAVGGMPEIVLEYQNSRNFAEVREHQLRLIDYYRMDFSKHAGANLVTRLNQVWNSIPSQLAKENRKFIFGNIAKGARAKDFELALQWLSDCGLIYRVNRISKAGIPIKAYEEFGAFKVYMNDVGMLGAMGQLPVKSIIEGNVLFEEFKGALTEQYVLNQLISDCKIYPYYYSTANSSGEIDFIIQKDDIIIPIEVKSEENLRAKSLKAFVAKNPEAKAVRISMSDYREQDYLTNMPLYAFMTMI